MARDFLIFCAGMLAGILLFLGVIVLNVWLQIKRGERIVREAIKERESDYVKLLLKQERDRNQNETPQF